MLLYEMETINKTVEDGIIVKLKASDKSDYDATFVMSASTVDRDGDTIDAKAYEPYSKSDEKIIALWQHKT